MGIDCRWGIRLAAVGVALFTCIHGAAATTYRVKPAGSDSGDGQTWGTALASVTNALDRSTSGDEIWIAAGTYKPTADTDRTKSFQLKSGVALYGGFAGSEATQDERNWSNTLSILSGDISTEGVCTDNVYQVVLGANGARLDGLVIRDGHADGPANETRTGGALYSVGHSMAVANCVFTNNIARGGDYSVFGGAGGAAVFWYQGAYTPAVLEFSRCVFADNVVSNTAGRQAYGSALQVVTLTNVTCTISNCAFANNRAHGQYAAAGAVALRNANIGATTWSGGRMLIQDCHFSGNQSLSYSPGAAYITGIPIPVEMTNCVFTGNWAGGNHSTPGGGALYLSIPASAYGVLADNCRFENNAIPAGFGGAIHIATACGTNSHWRQCTFEGNDARGNGGGGAISGTLNGIMDGCAFEANFNWNTGGAVFINAAGATASAVFTNCVFLCNTNAGNAGGGGAVAITPPSMNVAFYGCGFSSNASGRPGGAVSFATGTGTGTFESCTFEANRITAGNHMGGAISIASGALAIRRSAFITNTAVYAGAVDINASQATIEDCLFMNNIGQYQGAVRAITPVTIRRSVFLNNRARDNTSGLSYGGGVILNHAGKTSVIANCVFRGNSGWDGGAIVCFNGGSLIVSNITAVDNVSRRGASYGGAIYHVDTATNLCRVFNSILWSNSTEIVPATGVDCVHSCVNGGFAGDGNTNVNPAFVDSVHLHLQSATAHYDGGYFTGGTWVVGTAYSPLIDAGDPLSDFSLETPPNGYRINMGAYGNTEVASRSYRAPGTLFVIH